MYNQILQQQNLDSSPSGMGWGYILPEALSESKFISQAGVLDEFIGLNMSKWNTWATGVRKGWKR